MHKEFRPDRSAECCASLPMCRGLRIVPLDRDGDTDVEQDWGIGPELLKTDDAVVC